jgi:thiosulfate/3-mercaptopyruvate sulfurtransferase
MSPTPPASPLVTPSWLAAHLGEPGIVVVDVRWYLKGKKGSDAYAEGHLPTAVFADVDRDLSSLPAPGRPGRHPLPHADAFADFLARIGVGEHDVVVAYDDGGGATAARLWWLLRYFGHDGGRVLEGGIQAWVEAGHPLETGTQTGTQTGTVQRPRAARLHLVPRPEMVVDKRRVREILSGSEGVVLDARAPERYQGLVEPIDARPGHVPGAKSAPFSGNLATPGGRFLAPDDLRARYAALGALAARPVVAYCGSGVTACHDLLALSLIGRPDALLYEGSWGDWAADLDLPAALGES